MGNRKGSGLMICCAKCRIEGHTDYVEVLASVFPYRDATVRRKLPNKLVRFLLCETCWREIYLGELIPESVPTAESTPGDQK